MITGIKIETGILKVASVITALKSKLQHVSLMDYYQYGKK